MEEKHKMPIGREFLIAVREQEDQTEEMFEEWYSAEVELRFGRSSCETRNCSILPRLCTQM